MNANGSGQTQLTTDPAVDADPSFRPDDNAIAFTTDRDGNFEVYTMDASGNNETRLTNSIGYDGSPFYGP